MINVTKTFLPPIAEYQEHLEKIWASGWITNFGPKATELESKLKTYLEVSHLRFVCNGTIAIQIAIQSLDLHGEIITTPFSYVATTSSIAWEKCVPIFVDIEATYLTLDPDKIEAAITPRTSAILATHVYGNPCNVEKIQVIADKHKLKVIYDAAHSFGVTYKGKSILSYGDVSTLSFHATKIFHTIEGGAIVTRAKEIDHKVLRMMNFGHNDPENFQGVGINAKSSEFNAAMGLCILPRVRELIQKRKCVTEYYNSILTKNLAITRLGIREGTVYNYSYYPVIFRSEEGLLKVRSALNGKNIFPRRYFYPSLSVLNYVQPQRVPIAEDISKRILCLPLFHDLETKQIDEITAIILRESV